MSNEKVVRAAFEKVRTAIDDDFFAKLFCDDNDKLGDNFYALLTNCCPKIDSATHFTDSAMFTDPTLLAANNTQFHLCFTTDDPLSVEMATAPPSTYETTTRSNAVNGQTSHEMVTRRSSTKNIVPLMSDKIETFWPLNNAYCPGIVAEEQN